MSNRIEDILYFWFGNFPDPYTADAGKTDMWFGNGAAYDTEIFLQFGVDHERAISGELDHWAESCRGRLALIILLDQFSRHIHRGSAQAFAQDEKAQALCIEGMGAGDDMRLHTVERSFFYLPLEHAEDAEKQALSVRAYQRLLEDVPEDYRQPWQITLQYAIAHKEVIDRFGRFPELNDILGRKSTQEELAFIEKGSHNFL